MTVVELPSTEAAALDVLAGAVGRGWRPLSDLLVAIQSEPEGGEAPADDPMWPAFRWLVDPMPTVWQPSAHDRRCRDRATVLVCRAASAGVGPGAGFYRLYQELEPTVRRPGRERAVRAAAATFGSQYLDHVGADLGGGAGCLAVRDGRLVDPSALALDDQLDGICWVQSSEVCDVGSAGGPSVRTTWTIDVLSVAKRPGQLISDCAAGRVQRAVRLAATEGVAEAGAVAVRVFAPGMSRPRLAFEAISAVEVQRRFAALTAGDDVPGSGRVDAPRTKSPVQAKAS